MRLGILERDGHVGSEQLHELELFLGKARVSAESLDGQDALNPVRATKRRDDDRASLGSERSEVHALVRKLVLDQLRLTASDHFPAYAFVIGCRRGQVLRGVDTAREDR